MKSLIWGVTGQVGSYLAELLLKEGHEVFGVARRTSTSNTSRLFGILDKIQLVEGDITDCTSVHRILREIRPDQIYNLAAQSFVKASFEQPHYTFNTIVNGQLNLLEGMRFLPSEARLFHASSSEMFGTSLSYRSKVDPKRVEWDFLKKEEYEFNGFFENKHEVWQDENTPFFPQSPYACAKLAAHHLTIQYRQSYGLNTRCGILFNMESPRRGEKFVTRKITKWAGANYFSFLNGGLSPEFKLRLGNVAAKRDWTHAEDSVRAIYMMTEAEPDEYVVCSGETRSVEDFLKYVVDAINPNLRVEDTYLVDESLYRPSEVPYLKGSFYKINNKLGWRPEISWEQLVEDMLEHDVYLPNNRSVCSLAQGSS